MLVPEQAGSANDGTGVAWDRCPHCAAVIGSSRAFLEHACPGRTLRERDVEGIVGVVCRVIAHRLRSTTGVEGPARAALLAAADALEDEANADPLRAA